MAFNTSSKWLIQTPDRTEANNPPLYYKNLAQDIENRAAGAAQIVADITARNAIPSGQLYAHKRVITLADGIEWKYLGSKWWPWESQWVAYGATNNWTNGATGSNVASYRYSGGDILVKLKITIGSSSPALPTGAGVNYLTATLPTLPSGMSYADGNYTVSGAGTYQRVGSFMADLGTTVNSGNFCVSPKKTQTLNGTSQPTDSAAWPVSGTPPQSDTIYGEIRLALS